MVIRTWYLQFLSIILFSCAAIKSPVKQNSRLKFIAQYKISNEERFQNTTVGGLSGIDYNAEKDEYYLISDDRSANNPARFYTAKFKLDQYSIDSFHLTGLTYLLNPQQQMFPKYADDTLHSCDPEDIRYNPKTNEWSWCSEGERYLRKGAIYLQDPWIYNITNDGKFKDSFLLPGNLHMSVDEKGPRRNSTFEGLSFADGYRWLYASLEEPLYQDGRQAATGDTSAWVRIIKFDTETKKPIAQYAYNVDPVNSIPNPANAFKINGISEILAVDNDRLIVIERSYSTGVKQNTIKIYLANLEGASDVSAVSSLAGWKGRATGKKLLLNMDGLGFYIDNIEGACLGPKLPNGKPSLVFISDNNFNDSQVTQLLLFEVD